MIKQINEAYHGQQLEFFKLQGSELREGGSDLSSCPLRSLTLTPTPTLT